MKTYFIEDSGRLVAGPDQAGEGAKILTELGSWIYVALQHGLALWRDDEDRLMSPRQLFQAGVSQEAREAVERELFKGSEPWGDHHETLQLLRQLFPDREEFEGPLSSQCQTLLPSLSSTNGTLPAYWGLRQALWLGDNRRVLRITDWIRHARAVLCGPSIEARLLMTPGDETLDAAELGRLSEGFKYDTVGRYGGYKPYGKERVTVWFFMSRALWTQLSALGSEPEALTYLWGALDAYGAWEQSRIFSD